MASFFSKTGRDTLHNGTVLGAVAGALVVWGGKVNDFLMGIIPASWATFAGDWSIPIIIIALGGLVGYMVDRY